MHATELQLKKKCRFQSQRHQDAKNTETLHKSIPISTLQKRTGNEENSFSNSLITHRVKTKKITTEKEVWIPGLN